jgi:hypothetical protein
MEQSGVVQSGIVQFAEMLALFGVIGLGVAAVNVFALRVVRVDEVPSCAQGRIRWWGAHNTAFLLGCAALTVLSLGTLAIA